MGTHDFHYRVRWDQFEAAYSKHGGAVLNGDGPVFLEDVYASRARWEKGATAQLTRYCQFISCSPSEDQERLRLFVKKFSPYFDEPPVATYRDPNGYGLAFPPDETETIKRLVNAISISKALHDYERFLESDMNSSEVQPLIWMERYLAAILEFWGGCLSNFGMVYTRF